MSSKDAGDLKRDYRGSVHEQRREEHAIRDHLRRHREEVKVRLRATSILNGSVAQRAEQSVEEVKVIQEDPVYDLSCVSNSAERNAGN